MRIKAIFLHGASNDMPQSFKRGEAEGGNMVEIYERDPFMVVELTKGSTVIERWEIPISYCIRVLEPVPAEVLN